MVTNQLEKVKGLAAVHSGKDGVEERNDQYASSSKGRMQGFCKDQVQDAIKTLGKYAHQAVSEKEKTIQLKENRREAINLPLTEKYNVFDKPRSPIYAI